MERRNSLLFLQLNSNVYRLFIRLYAIYPCNFFNYLKTTYGSESKDKDNEAVFRQIIEPMLSRIRFHPFLITASKEKECENQRWFHKEPCDILDECGQYSIDPIEFNQESDFYEQLFIDESGEFAQLDDSSSEDESRVIDDSTFNDQQDERPKYEEGSNAIFSKLSQEMINTKSSAVYLLSELDEESGSKNAEFSTLR